MAKAATELKETDYAHPEVLVDTAWVAEHAGDPKVKLVEVDVDTSAYDTGHIKGAIGLDWRKDLQARPIRDLLAKEDLEKLLSSKGISNEDTVVVYGDNNNWFAAWFVWNLKYYGHKDARLINGGRKKWQDEGRELVTDAPTITPASYKAGQPDKSIRALRDEVFRDLGKAGVALVDGLERAILVGRLGPRDALRAGYVTRPLRRLGHAWRSDDFAVELGGRAHVDQRTAVLRPDAAKHVA